MRNRGPASYGPVTPFVAARPHNIPVQYGVTPGMPPVSAGGEPNVFQEPEPVYTIGPNVRPRKRKSINEYFRAAKRRLPSLPSLPSLPTPSKETQEAVAEVVNGLTRGLMEVISNRNQLSQPGSNVPRIEERRGPLIEELPPTPRRPSFRRLRNREVPRIQYQL